MTGPTDLLDRIMRLLAEAPAEPARLAAELGQVSAENPCAVEPFGHVVQLDVSAGPEGSARSIRLRLAPGSEIPLTDLLASHGRAVQAGVAGPVQMLAFHWSGPVRLYATLAEGGRGSSEFTAERIG